MSEIKLELHTGEILDALETQLKQAATAIGMQAETYAKQLSQYDTGYQRNSIAYAISGGPASVSSYQADRPDETGKLKTGSYSGIAPSDEDVSVYIGTNVKYAEVNEWRKPYLRPAVIDHKTEYKAIVENALKK